MARPSTKKNAYGKVSPREEYALGTPAEIAQRDSTGFQPPMSSFNQPKPSKGGRNMADPSPGRRSGNYKFNKPVG